MELTKKRLGAVAVLNDAKVIGVITDGDIRRMLEREDGINDLDGSRHYGWKPNQHASQVICG